MSSREGRNPATWTRGEVWDAYQLAVRQGENIYRENLLLHQRQAALEDYVRADVLGSLEAGRCTLGFCTPAWSQAAGRYVHVEPCLRAKGERLLAGRVEASIDYGPGGDGDYVGRREGGQ